MHKPAREQGRSVPARVISPHVSKGGPPNEWPKPAREQESPRHKPARKQGRKSYTNRPLNAFHESIKQVSPPMFDWDAPHLKLLIETLQLVTEGKIKRLMCVLIQTRWHEDDLANRILRQQQEDGTNEWHVISLPAGDAERKVRTGSGSDWVKGGNYE